MSDKDVKALRVRDLLLIPQLREAKLLGGAAGLDNDVSRVNVMEVPDIVGWVRPGEFLMTTGYPHRENPEVLAELLPQLVQNGVAALGIKTKRFIDEVPKIVIEAANYYGLPLLELPPDTTFSDVVREVMERVLVKEARQLSILQSRIQQIAEVLLHGGGLEKFMNHLAYVVDNPVVLIDSHNQITMSVGTEIILSHSGMLGEIQRIREDVGIGLSYLKIGERKVRVYISVVPDRQLNSTLMLLLEEQQEYGLIDMLTMDRAGELVGFEIINALTRKEIEAKYIDQFLQDWLVGRITSFGDLRMRAEACGSDLIEGDYYRVGIVRFTKEQLDMGELRSIVKRLRSESLSWLRVTVVEGQLVMLLSAEAGKLAREMEISRLIKLYSTKLNYTMCMGCVTSHALEVSESYMQAKRTFEINSLGWVSSGVVSDKSDALYYEELGIYLLLYKLPDCRELEVFKRKFLYPLLDYDRTHQSVLIDTLNAYYKHNGNMRAASEELFTHYNTVANRLERVQEVLGLQMNDPEVTLQLQVALKMVNFKQ